jgi:hypothetical protein
MKYENRIASLKKKVKDIDKNSVKFGHQTYWLQEGTYADNRKEFLAVKKGAKPMGLISPNSRTKDIIEKAKKFCDKKSGYSWAMVLNNQFVYGKNFNVYATQHIGSFSNFDIALGLLLGYSKEHVSAFEIRLMTMLRGQNIHYPVRPIKSRNPIKDVLSSKRELVEINFKTDKGSFVSAKTANKKIEQVKKLCKDNKKLSFMVLYKGKYGKPFIVFGKKTLINKIYLSSMLP